MANFCIPEFAVEKMKKALKDGSFSTERVALMSSESRSALFEEYVGPKLAKELNQTFESKLMLKHVYRGLRTWENQFAKDVKPAARKDILARIDRMAEVFKADSLDTYLADLAERKLGLRVSYENAQTINKTVNELRQTRNDIAKWEEANGKDIPETHPLVEKHAILERTQLKIMEKLAEDQFSWDNRFTNWKWWRDQIFGNLKSLASAADNSFFGRQGRRILVEKPGLWFKEFWRSWKDIASELGGKGAMEFSEMQVLRMKEWRDGTFDRMGVDILRGYNEFYPSHTLGKTPGIKRFYKASETAFNAGALRLRAEFARHLAKQAKEFGIDTVRDVESMKTLGNLANTMTGVGKTNLGKTANVIMFSPRWFKAQIDVLTALPKEAMMEFNLSREGVGAFKSLRDIPHEAQLPYSRGEIMARRIAAKNTIRYIAHMAALLYLLKEMGAEVELDPRSSDFGKAKFGNTRFDISNGLGAFVTLGARLLPTSHNGDWGWWTKSGGKYRKVADLAVRDDKADFQIESESILNTSFDYLVNFFANKASPGLSLGITTLRGQTFDGDPVTGSYLAQRALYPIPVQTYIEAMDDPMAADMWAVILTETLGVGVNTYK